MTRNTRSIRTRAALVAAAAAASWLVVGSFSGTAGAAEPVAVEPVPAVEFPDPQVPVGPDVFTGCPQEPAGPDQDGCGDGLPPEPPDPPEPPPWVGADDITDCPKSPTGDPNSCDDTDDPPPPEPPPWVGANDFTDCPKSPTDEPTECGDDSDDGGVEEPEDESDETEVGGGQSGGGLLAQTGANVGQLLLVGAGLTAGGMGIALLARRLRR